MRRQTANFSLADERYVSRWLEHEKPKIYPSRPSTTSCVVRVYAWTRLRVPEKAMYVHIVLCCFVLLSSQLQKTHRTVTRIYCAQDIENDFLETKENYPNWRAGSAGTGTKEQYKMLSKLCRILKFDNPSSQIEPPRPSPSSIPSPFTSR